MSEVLHRTVGFGGSNYRDDIALVQRLLVKKGYSLGRVDGMCGRRTVAAIVNFQSTFLRRPDGLISPGGPTWQQLNGGQSHPAAPHQKGGKPAVPQAKRNDKFTELLPMPPR